MTYFDIFDAFTPLPNYRHKPSIYVVSDSEMKAYRERQLKAEVLELRKLVDYHKTQADRLEEEITRIETELLPPSEDWRYRRVPAPFSLYVLYKYKMTSVQIKAAQRLQLAFTRQDREKMHSLLNLRQQGARGVNVE